MAWYTGTDVRYRGRLIHVRYRYGAFMSAVVSKGTPLVLRGRDYRNILRLVDRTPACLERLRAQEEAIFSHDCCRG